MTSSRLPYVLTAALLVAAIVVASVVISTLGSKCDDGACEPPELALPHSSLRYTGNKASGVATTTVALFVDLNSHASRRLFTTAVRAIDSGELNSAELLLYHAPTGECTGSPPSYSCDAARAAECAEEQRPGAGVELAALALDRLWSPAPALDLVGLLEAATDLHLDPGKLSDCVDPSNRLDIVEKVRTQRSWARSRGLERAPGGFIIRRTPPRELEGDTVAAKIPPERVVPFDDGVTRVELHRLWACAHELTAASCDEEGVL